METVKKVKAIDMVVIFKKMKENRKLYYKVLPVVFVLSCLIIICVPRTYTTDTTVVPELDNSKGGGTLSSLASSFGLNMDMLQTSDAITPLLYPDLMSDNKFVSELFNIKVRTADGEVNTTYAKYILEHTKLPWWGYAIAAAKSLLPKKSGTVVAGKGDKFDPYCMSRDEDDLANAVRASISIGVDKKTGVIGIATAAQDPLVCKILADSTRRILLDYITNYRTNKARTDMAYYHNLLVEAKADYERARQLQRRQLRCSACKFPQQAGGSGERDAAQVQCLFHCQRTVSGGEGTRAGTHSGFHLAQRRSRPHQGEQAETYVLRPCHDLACSLCHNALFRARLSAKRLIIANG